MFTIAQIKEAHSKVKSGEDFPAYIQDLIELGVQPQFPPFWWNYKTPKAFCFQKVMGFL